MSITEIGRESANRLAGEVVHVIGRPHGLPQARLQDLVARHGGKYARRISAKVTLLALAHSAAAAVADDGGLGLRIDPPEAATLIGENELRRRLGLGHAAQDAAQSFGTADLERVSGLSQPVIRALELFDVVEPVGDRFAYRDLLAAREVKRLREAGAPLRAIIEADLELRRRGQRLSDTRLAANAAGQLLHSVGGTLAELSGQFVMPFSAPAIDMDEECRAAEAAELDGDFAKAESLYTTLMRIDQRDPVLPFNLGNVLRAQGRSAEAKVAWQMAVARDPSLAEAWYNLALASEDEGHKDLAIAQYRRAVEALPDYEDARFNLALLLTRADRCAEALPMWQALLDADLTAEQMRIAKRAAKLCRLQLSADRSQTG
jgi:tetratricopeptide (TPR) repeat protein